LPTGVRFELDGVAIEWWQHGFRASGRATIEIREGKPKYISSNLDEVFQLLDWLNHRREELIQRAISEARSVLGRLITERRDKRSYLETRLQELSRRLEQLEA